jgi:hypothetical protein
MHQQGNYARKTTRKMMKEILYASPSFAYVCEIRKGVKIQETQQRKYWNKHYNDETDTKMRMREAICRNWRKKHHKKDDGKRHCKKMMKETLQSWKKQYAGIEERNITKKMMKKHYKENERT